MMTATTQLLILGNGFDLHCGLQSSYKSFFETAILDTYKERFGITQMKADVSGFWEGLLLEYYKVYRDNDYNWCDIESIIQGTLWQICFGEYDDKPNKNLGLWKPVIECLGVNSIDYSSIEDPIELYIIRYCFRFFLHLNRREQLSDEQKLQSLLNILLQELRGFEKRFCKYIKGNILDSHGNKGLNTQYILNAVSLIAKLTNFTDNYYPEIWDMFVRPENAPLILKKEYPLVNEFANLKNTYILSFNYTALFDIMSADSPCSYNNVHGKLCNKNCAETCNASNIIFGIDDTLVQSQTEVSELRLFSKTYRKMSNMATPTKVLPSNELPVTIKFYGHSLSQADYSYFQSIFDYYNIYGNNNVSLIFYYSEGFEQTDAIYKLINSYGKTLNNQEQGKNLMHKLLLENRLKIQKI